MHEIIPLDLGTPSWRTNGNNNLTVGVWTPYTYHDLKETGRLFFILVSDRAVFSERIFQEPDAESVKIELIQYLRNNHPHSYIIREKMSTDDQKSYIGDFRTMKPFLQSFRDLTPEQLLDFAEKFVALTNYKLQSDKADFLVNVLDGDSDLHYELARKLPEIHQKAENAEKQIQLLIHNLRQNTLHTMAENLLKELSDKSETDENTSADSDFDDSSSSLHRILRGDEARALGRELMDSMKSSPRAEDDFSEPLTGENERIV